MTFTKEELALALQRAFVDYDVSEFTEQDFNDALTGQTHRTISDFDLDSLDVVEIVMGVEDTFNIYFDESLDEKIIASTLLEEIPDILMNCDYEDVIY